MYKNVFSFGVHRIWLHINESEEGMDPMDSVYVNKNTTLLPFLENLITLFLLAILTDNIFAAHYSHI